MKKEKNILDIHIGTIIKAKAAEREISEVELAKMIHCHHSNVHYIYGRKSINTDQLWLISEALEYDFFTEIYGKNLSEKVKRKQDTGTITIVITTDKVSIEQNNGIIKQSEYNKSADK
jgi:hypothetical protein